MQYPAQDNFSEFAVLVVTRDAATSFPGGHSEWEPPDPIPNSEVKLLSADDSVGFPHVKVGHCQGSIAKPADPDKDSRVFFCPHYA
jgi:hypothetical protein